MCHLVLVNGIHVLTPNSGVREVNSKTKATSQHD